VVDQFVNIIESDQVVGSVGVLHFVHMINGEQNVRNAKEVKYVAIIE
jgi:hypothetical protein